MRLPLSTPLRGLPCAVLDTETTGLDPSEHGIVEIAVVHVELGSEEDPRVAFRSRVRAPMPIDEGASQVHGITDEDLVDAPTWEEVIDEVVAACSLRTVVAYNAPFDWGHIAADCRRIGLDAEPEEIAWPWLDVRVAVEVADKYQKGKKLADAARRRRISYEPHGAVADALVTAMLLAPVLREALRASCQKASVPTTLDRLLVWQRRAALAREADFVEWCRRNGRAARPDTPWHDLEGKEPPPWPEPEPAEVHVDADGVVHRREP